jgi:hypothetical protein
MSDPVYVFRDFYVPERMMGGLIRYVHHRVLPGDFLQAVIKNDLREAVGLADEENIRNLPAFVAWLYNEAPSQCWGSKEKMLAWSERRKEASNED